MYKVTSKLHADNVYSDVINGKKVSVHIKGHHKGVTTDVSDEQADMLVQNGVFQMHKKNGFVTLSEQEYADEKGEALPDDKDESDEGDGEKKANLALPSTHEAGDFYELAEGGEITIEEIVKQVFDKSGMTEDKWNTMKPKTRDKLVQDFIDSLKIKE